MFFFKSKIVYTKSWRFATLIALIVGVSLPTFLILLEPFDTNNSNISYKNLKLMGYGLCLFLPVLLLHPIENLIYKNQDKTWYLINEIVYLVLLFLIAVSCCFIYHFYVIGYRSQMKFQQFIDFIWYFGLPFAPIIIPPWVYLRSKYGIIDVANKKIELNEKITITGENKFERLTIHNSDFVYAQAQHNYVSIYYRTSSEIQHKMIRSTLSNVLRQIPKAWRVHRSYLVNLNYLKSIEGNSRKRSISLSENLDTIPVSQKYYKSIQKRLSNSSLRVQ